MQETISKNKKEIIVLKAKIQQSKCEAFGTDLMNFSISGMRVIFKEGFNKI